MSRRSHGTNFAGGSSAARSGSPQGPPPANRSPICTRRCTTCPARRVAEAGRLRGIAAEIRDRGATVDPDGPRGRGAAYWPEVARLLRLSYRSLSRAINEETLPSTTEEEPRVAVGAET